MGYGAQILADSMSPDGVRLTTFEVDIPRIVLAEFNTHRMFSRNSASSRAIPVSKMIERVMEDPYIPDVWGSNMKGMQAGHELVGVDAIDCDREWLVARDMAVSQAQKLLALGLHKQITNRLLEPWMWHTAIITGTEWDNFFHLRNNAMAHPAIATPAAMMQKLYEELKPRPLPHDTWHLPLMDETAENWADDQIAPTIQGPERWRLAYDIMVKISVGRCARVSYLTHDGKRDPQADIELHDRLLTSGHMSPFEHVARPAHCDYAQLETCMAKVRDVDIVDLDGSPTYDVEPEDMWFGNFRGWVQYRKTIAGEADMLGGNR